MHINYLIKNNSLYIISELLLYYKEIYYIHIEKKYEYNIFLTASYVYWHKKIRLLELN